MTPRVKALAVAVAVGASVMVYAVAAVVPGQGQAGMRGTLRVR